MADSHRMSAVELRASVGLAGISGLRMLGMFIILPVFALYAERLPGGDSHTLVGLALGAYGLMQALFQVPFGWLSDHWGRKQAIYLGLAVLALGSFIAALAQDMYTVILGRMVQGTGAVSASVIALTADLTRDEQRTKAMAVIGLTIGAAFAVSMVAGPVLNRVIGVPGIFALTGALALGAMLVLRWVVPPPGASTPSGHAAAVPARVALRAILVHPDLARLNYGIFVLHGVLMALFVVVPFSLRDAGLAPRSHWQVYLPVMAGSILLMVPPMIASERRGQQKPAFLFGIAVLLAAQILLALFEGALAGLALSLLVFFTGFNLLEASLPSLVSKTAPSQARGTAVGVYSSVQFLGAFVGAAAGGFVSQHFGTPAVFLLCALLTLSWLLVAWPMTAPAAVGLRT